MAQQILLSCQELHSAQKNSDCVIVDCRFDLIKPNAAYQDYLKSHIPGAVYAHLDNDLSSPASSDSGRHPLPDANKFASFLSRSGWQPGMMLVAYDDIGGAIAARLWWLMKYFGHDGAALLDGGLPAWQAEGYELESGLVSVPQLPLADFRVSHEMVMTTSEIIEKLVAKQIVLADARARERFIGEIEPIDTVAGHIPGSVNYAFSVNLEMDGRFKSAQELRCGLLTVTENDDAQNLVHSCGSGVTACHNIFAAELAGLKGSRLYVGSWSEWIRDPSRPIAP
jgi:thiosulfate/3-mercaptopyruvate sulfurtransferase